MSLEHFIAFMKMENRSTHTIKQYAYHVDMFLNWLNKPIQQTTENDLFNYIQELYQNQHLKTNTINVVVNAIRKYTKIMDVPLKWNTVPIPATTSDFNPRILTKQQVNDILLTPTNHKHYLMLKTGYYACLRAGELCRLEVNDLVQPTHSLTVVPEKHGKTTNVPLPKTLVHELQDYIKDKHLTKSNYLFPTRTGSMMNPNYFSSRIFTPVVKQLKLDCRYHDFARHTRLTQLIMDGYSFEVVNQIARHRNPAQTLAYITLTGMNLRQLMSPTNRTVYDEVTS